MKPLGFAGALGRNQAPVSYNTNGVLQWTIQDGTAGGTVMIGDTLIGVRIAADKAGNCVVTGSTTVAIDGQAQHGATDLFLAKYNATGTRLWTVQDGAAAGVTHGAGIALDSSNSIFVTGRTSAPIDGQSQHGANDLFITKYTGGGVRF